MKSIFDNRRLFIATMHGKELVIGKSLNVSFDIEYYTDISFNTDMFGTFSGEINRVISPYEAALNKCKLAYDKYGTDLVVASEGSFYMTYGFISTNHELLLLKDFKNNIEIKTEQITYDTNFNGRLFSNEEDLESLEEYLNDIKFPSHAVILRDREGSVERVEKGIVSSQVLKSKVKEYLSDFNSVYIETDMRAMFNPTRMNAIAKASENLAHKMNTKCPSCFLPGFDVVKREKGLLCEVCLKPTKAIIKDVCICTNCAFEKELFYPDGKKMEDPMYCDNCNP